MQDPLKQGLKPAPTLPSVPILEIRMQDPLKQGLKRRKPGFNRSQMPDSNARSTKTRIETVALAVPRFDINEFECKIH